MNGEMTGSWPDAYFEEQLKEDKEHDICAVSGLHADGPSLSVLRLKNHLLRTFLPHVFEKGLTVRTQRRMNHNTLKVGSTIDPASTPF